MLGVSRKVWIITGVVLAVLILAFVAAYFPISTASG
jgi:hypothetical protein